ncbi:MAG: hypothetical protein NTY30_02470 [Candidatus Berkelbacteria bacterium]|nr:hypothetical protein [Candidatus Berkelbacteria bacterium]
MPNIQFFGFTEKLADEVIAGLVKLLPAEMDDTVYQSTEDAPVYATTGDSAPYIVIRDSDPESAIRIKDMLQKPMSCLRGSPDVEIQLVQFFQGDLNSMAPEDMDDR